MTRRRLATRLALLSVLLAAVAAAGLLLIAGPPEQRPFHVAVIGLACGSVAHMLRAQRLSWIGCCFVAACAAIALGTL